MKSVFALAVACIHTLIHAQQVPPEKVAAECVRQMSLGICTTRPDKSKIAPGQTIMMSGVGRVSYSAYLDFMNLYDPKHPEETAMCKLALKYMKSEPGGDHDKIARALWTPRE
jgi:hypothetical protein